MIKLADGRHAAKAFIINGNRGHGLFISGDEAWVYEIFLPKGMNTWAAKNGRRYRSIFMAEQAFADVVDEHLPAGDCDQCGELYSELTKGCDVCIPMKQEQDQPGRVWVRTPQKGFQ